MKGKPLEDEVVDVKVVLYTQNVMSSLEKKNIERILIVVLLVVL